MPHGLKVPGDPWGKMTASMHQFNIGLQDWYISKDGFRHDLQFARRKSGPGFGEPDTGNRMTTRCLGCGANRTDNYSEVQTPENELIAIEVAHWQMNHRETCKVPLSGVKL